MVAITKTCTDCGTSAVENNVELAKAALQGCDCGEKYTFGGFENRKVNPNK